MWWIPTSLSKLCAQILYKNQAISRHLTIQKLQKLAGTVCTYSYEEKTQEHKYYLIMTIKKLKLNFTLQLTELYFAKPILCEHIFWILANVIGK